MLNVCVCKKERETRKVLFEIIVRRKMDVIGLIINLLASWHLILLTCDKVRHQQGNAMKVIFLLVKTAMMIDVC